MFLIEWYLFMADPSLSAGERDVGERETQRPHPRDQSWGGEAETSDLGVSGLETWLLIFHRLSPPADKEPLAEFWSSFVFLFNLHLT